MRSCGLRLESRWRTASSMKSYPQLRELRMGDLTVYLEFSCSKTLYGATVEPKYWTP